MYFSPREGEPETLLRSSPSHAQEYPWGRGCRKKSSFAENPCSGGINGKGLRLKPTALEFGLLDETHSAPAAEAVQVSQTSIHCQAPNQQAWIGTIHPSVEERQNPFGPVSRGGA